MRYHRDLNYESGHERGEKETLVSLGEVCGTNVLISGAKERGVPSMTPISGLRDWTGDGDVSRGQDYTGAGEKVGKAGKKEEREFRFH